MKKYYALLTGTMFLAVLQTKAQTKIGGSGAPDGSAMLEVTSGPSSNKGLLLPRMTTAQRDAITSPAKALMIYNTTTNQAEINNGTPVLPVWAATTTIGTAWTTTGNTGTNPATNFIGTTDNQDFTIRANNIEQARVTAAGSVGIGTNTPGAKLDVADTGDAAIRITTTTAEKMSFQLGSDNHGIIRNLTTMGGTINDVAVYTSTGFPGGTGSLYLVANPVTSHDSLPLNQFVLKNTGHVGIGTDTPGVKLEVVDTGDVAINVRSVVNRKKSVLLGNDNHGIVRNLTGSGGNVNDMAVYTSAAPGGTADLYLVANPTATGSNNLPLTQFVLKNTGRVGIGTDTPGVKLEVVDTGDVAITVRSTAGGKKSFRLGNANHGVIRDLTSSGGNGNDVALYTSTGLPNGIGDIHLIANPIASLDNNLPLDQFVLKNTGNVGIGTNAPTARLSVNGTTNNLSGTWGIFSDARVKTIDADYKDGLNTIMKIHPVKFHYNANAPFKSNEQQIGIIAQEMEAIAPYMVTKIKADGFDDLRQYNNQALPYMLVNAIQEQQTQIEALKAENQKLKNTEAVTAQLMERVKQMEQMMGVKEIEGTSKVAGK
ncbi:MAG: tail fiber domain-containing protein [Taibaiella sp.]|jgi:hypothetical protein